MELSELIEKMYETQAGMINGSTIDDQCLPLFVAEDKEGQCHAFSVPFDGEQSKLVILLFLRLKFKEIGAQRYVMSSEAWQITRNKEKYSDEETPSEAEDREDVLIIGAADINGKKMVAHAKIIVADDNKRHLEALNTDTYHDFSGRMLALLD